MKIQSSQLIRFIVGLVLIGMVASCAPTRRTTTHKKQRKSVPCPCENEGRR